MDYFLKAEGKEYPCHCRSCQSPLQMGSHRVIFCPICKTTLNGTPLPDWVMCCSECNSLLRVLANRTDGMPGSIYCAKCESVSTTHLVPRQ